MHTWDEMTRARTGHTRLNDALERFWRNVEPEKGDGCWLWFGNTSHGGYGTFKFPLGNGRNRVLFAHRISYLLANKSLPGNLVVRHMCGNRLCVNPNHLQIGTHEQNMEDKVRANQAGKILWEIGVDPLDISMSDLKLIKQVFPIVLRCCKEWLEEGKRTTLRSKWEERDEEDI